MNAILGALYFNTRFVYRLPIYYRREKLLIERYRKKLGHGQWPIANGACLTLPSDRIAAAVFERMLFERGSSREWKTFLRIRRGKKRFVDVGASGGFFSALFALTSEGTDSALLSVEIDPPSRAILDEVRALNGCEGCAWSIDQRGVSDGPGCLTFTESGYGAALATGGDGRPMDVETLETICRQHGMAPDLLKVDVEGMEYELITSSEDFLRRTRPAIHLELHSQMISARGKDPSEIFEVLARLGYRNFLSGRIADASRIAKQGERSHFFLTCDG